MLQLWRLSVTLTLICWSKPASQYPGSPGAFLAASKFSAITSLMVFRTETTVSSEKFWEELCCPPGRFLTKWGMACLPAAERRGRVDRESLRSPALRALIVSSTGTTHESPLHAPGRLQLQKGKGPGTATDTSSFLFVYLFSLSAALKQPGNFMSNMLHSPVRSLSENGILNTTVV